MPIEYWYHLGRNDEDTWFVESNPYRIVTYTSKEGDSTMFRFYRDFIERLYLAMRYFESANGAPAPDTVETWARGHYNYGGAHPIFCRAYEHHTTQGTEDIDVKKLLEGLEDRLAGRPDRAVAEASLIDKMIEVLRQPYATNVLSGKMLGALRNALLLPEESGPFLERLREKEMGCTTCGCPLIVGELSVRGENGFCCTACHRASYMAAAANDQKVTIPDEIRAAIATAVDSTEGLTVPTIEEEAPFEPDDDEAAPFDEDDEDDGERIYRPQPPTLEPAGEGVGNRLRTAAQRLHRITPADFIGEVAWPTAGWRTITDARDAMNHPTPGPDATTGRLMAPEAAPAPAPGNVYTEWFRRAQEVAAMRIQEREDALMRDLLNDGRRET